MKRLPNANDLDLSLISSFHSSLPRRRSRLPETKQGLTQIVTALPAPNPSATLLLYQYRVPSINMVVYPQAISLSPIVHHH